MKSKRPGRKLQVLINRVSAEAGSQISAQVFTKILNKGGVVERISDAVLAAKCNLRPEKFTIAHDSLIRAGLIECQTHLGGLRTHRLTAKGRALLEECDLHGRLVPEAPSPTHAMPAFTKFVVVPPRGVMVPFTEVQQ